MIFDIPDPTKVHTYLKNLSEVTAVPDSAAPSRGIVLLGYEPATGLVRRVQTTSDGKLVLWLG